MIEYPKEYGIEWKCPYGLVVISCRECLFWTLCHLQRENEKIEKEKSDLSDNLD